MPSLTHRDLSFSGTAVLRPRFVFSFSIILLPIPTNQRIEVECIIIEWTLPKET